jgi:hypothetical protein
MERLHTYGELDRGIPLLGTSDQARLPDGRAEQVRSWWAQLAEADAKGVFMGGAVTFLVAGTVAEELVVVPDMPPPIEGAHQRCMM